MFALDKDSGYCRKKLFKEAYYFLFLFFLSISYTALRFWLNIEYKTASWELLYQLKAPVPFCYRILIPVVSRPIVWGGFSIKEAFMFWEVIFSALMFFSIYKVLKVFVEERWAKFFSLSFVFVLPLIFLLKTKWPIYYPYDTPAMFFIVLGIFFILKEKWTGLFITVFFATLNRESSIIIIMLFCVLGIEKLSLKRFVTIAVALVLLYFLTKWGIKVITAGNPLPYKGSMAFIIGKDKWRVNNNYEWITQGSNLLIFFATFGWLPVLYLFLRGYVPKHFRSFGMVCAFYFSFLIFIGNLYEPRIFGEMAVVLFVPVTLAIYSYLTGTVISISCERTPSDNNMLLRFWDCFQKYYLVLLVFCVFFISFVINKLGVSYFY